VVEAAGQIEGDVAVAQAEVLEVVDVGEAVALVVVAAGVGQDEVVGEVEGVAGPGDEVVHLAGPAERGAAVEALVVLDVAQDGAVRVEVGALGAEKELAQFVGLAEPAGIVGDAADEADDGGLLPGVLLEQQ